MRVLAALSAVALAQAAQWYGIAPDERVAGQLNIFQMTPQGAITNATAAIKTTDQEYIKSGTFHCDWANGGSCFFMTGVQADLVQDAVYAVNRFTGAVVFKHSLPAGIYSDNLVHDYLTNTLFYVAFDPRTRAVNIVKISALTGVVSYVFDVTRDFRGGFVWGGDVTYCATDGHLFVGVDTGAAADGAFHDFFIRYDVSGAQPRLMDVKELVFPITSSLHAVCNFSIFGTTIQADAFDREKVMIVDYNLAGPEGYFTPVIRGDLPTFSQRGELPLFLGNLNADFNGTVLVPVFPPFQRGPGPAPPIEFSLLWTVDVGARRPGTLSPLRYYLAGAAGVPEL